LSAVITIEEILDFMPHRYPMLLVDRILEVDEEAKRCVGIKNVTINEAFFQGHYPGRPIMPGVLIIEAMAQVGCALVLRPARKDGKIPIIGAIEEVKFRRPVIPGDQLRTECELLWMRGTVGKFKACGTVDGEVVATMEVVFKLRDRDR
jgi:beta-hydroxyacyl-ACP dehydratase FabZ